MAAASRPAQVVVTGARASHRYAARAHPLASSRCRTRLRHHLHDGFEHLRHRLRREPVVTMPPIAIAAQHTGIDQLREVAACGGGGNTGSALTVVSAALTDGIRVISLRKANDREVKHYAKVPTPD